METTETNRRVYYISDRPEAYEFWGEIGHDEARHIGRLVAERAGMRFPTIEFRVDGEWHVHQRDLDEISAFIEDHLPDWVAEVMVTTAS